MAWIKPAGQPYAPPLPWPDGVPPPPGTDLVGQGPIPPPPPGAPALPGAQPVMVPSVYQASYQAPAGAGAMAAAAVGGAVAQAEFGSNGLFLVMMLAIVALVLLPMLLAPAGGTSVLPLLSPGLLFFLIFAGIALFLTVGGGLGGGLGSLFGLGAGGFSSGMVGIVLIFGLLILMMVLFQPPLVVEELGG